MKSFSALITLVMVFSVTTTLGQNYIRVSRPNALRIPELESTADTRQEVIRNYDREWDTDDVPNVLAQYKIQGHKDTMRRMKTNTEDTNGESENIMYENPTLMEKYLRYFSYLMVKDKINKPRKQNLYGRHKYPKWV